jgi:hypothetical protein
MSVCVPHSFSVSHFSCRLLTFLYQTLLCDVFLCVPTQLFIISFLMQIANILPPDCIMLMSVCSHTAIHNPGMIIFLLQVPHILLPDCIMLMSVCSHTAIHNPGMIIFLLQVPHILLPGCIMLMSVCSDTAIHNPGMIIFLLQVPHILLPGCLQLLAAPVSRYTQPRLANGLRAPPHLPLRLTEHHYLSLLRLLFPYGLQGHRRLRGKFQTCTVDILVGTATI